MTNLIDAVLYQRDLIEVNKKKALPITPDDVQAILDDEATHPKYKTLSLLMFFGAARVSEAIGLRWRSIDFVEGTLTRPVLKKGKRSPVTKGKYNTGIRSIAIIEARKMVTIPLPQGVIELLRDFYRLAGEPSPDTFIVPNRQGFHVSKQAFNSQLKLIATRLGWDTSRVSSHSFRRGWATYAITVAGYSPQQAMTVTSHSSQIAFYEYIDLVGR